MLDDFEGFMIIVDGGKLVPQDYNSFAMSILS